MWATEYRKYQIHTQKKKKKMQENLDKVSSGRCIENNNDKGKTPTTTTTTIPNSTTTAWWPTPFCARVTQPLDDLVTHTGTTNDLSDPKTQAAIVPFFAFCRTQPHAYLVLVYRGCGVTEGQVFGCSVDSQEAEVIVFKPGDGALPRPPLLDPRHDPHRGSFSHQAC